MVRGRAGILHGAQTAPAGRTSHVSKQARGGDVHVHSYRRRATLSSQSSSSKPHASSAPTACRYLTLCSIPCRHEQAPLRTATATHRNVSHHTRTAPHRKLWRSVCNVPLPLRGPHRHRVQHRRPALTRVTGNAHNSGVPCWRPPAARMRSRQAVVCAHKCRSR